ncbi:MAG: GYD domain-containing protein [Actinomycetota bacterium]|nr:GYD domain-containing protein [Actinomycetota bacterium]
MPTYVVLMNWTDQGAKSAADTVDRYEAAKDALAERGVTIKEIYWTTGACDIVTIAEAADDETASAGLLRLASQGNLRTTTMRAFTADEMRSVVEKSR